jgi:hypothetical protein
MATGIEMLGQMGTDQALAGPVQGGNMVVKPNQVPVGGAAMLSKALRGQADKGVGGMYILPEQEDQTPDFMKMAQMSVEKEMANRKNQYPNNYATEEGGLIPMLPRNLKTSLGAPETTLAYITPEEQAILGLLNPGTPHRGPEDVPSYDSDPYDEQQVGQTYTPSYSGGGDPSGGRRGMAESMASVGISGLGGGVTDDKKGRKAEREQRKAGYTPISDAAQTANKAQVKEDRKEKTKQENKVDRLKDELKKAKDSGDQEEINNLENLIKTESTFLEKIMADIAGRDKQIREEGGLFDKAKVAKDKLIDQLKKLGMVGPEIKAIEDLPENTQKEMLELLKNFDRLEVSPKDAMSPLMTTLKSMGSGLEREDGSMTLEGLTKALRGLDTEGGASVLETLKKYAPEKHFKAFGEPTTVGGFESFAMNKTVDANALRDKYGADSDEYKNAKRYNNAIFEARESAGRDRERQGGGRPRGMGGGAGPVIEDEVTEAVVEEGATTMPYTGPRTGGAEANVPLSRRFALDPTQEVAQYRTQPRSTEDIYKYYTQGTEGEGRMLEPYGEFQKRRRKALGKEPLDFWSY